MIEENPMKTYELVVESARYDTGERFRSPWWHYLINEEYHVFMRIKMLEKFPNGVQVGDTIVVEVYHWVANGRCGDKHYIVDIKEKT